MSGKCSICGAADLQPWLTECPDYYLSTGIVVSYGICQSCGLVQQVPMPDNADAFYPDYPMHEPCTWLTSMARAVFHRQVYLRPSKAFQEMRLLDYGCGSGSFIRSARAQVRDIFGFEPDREVARKASALCGAKIYHDYQELVSDLDGTVDYVTAHFVLEHALNLNQTFEVIAKILKSGGRLYAVVPNIKSWEARWFGRKWHGLDAPRHISFPDETSLSILAARCGLKLLSVNNAAFPNALAASLSTCLAGRCHPVWYHLFIPAAILLSSMFPSGARAYLFEKRGIVAERRTVGRPSAPNT